MKRHPTDTDLDFLHECTKEELEFLVRVIIDAGGMTNGLKGRSAYEMNPSDPTKYVDAIIEEIQLYAGNTVANSLRGYGVPYREALLDTLTFLRVASDKRNPLPRLEDDLIRLGIPEFLKHVKDEETRNRLGAFWTDLGKGCGFDGNLGRFDPLTEFRMWWKYVVWGNAGILWASAEPARRVVVPSVIYIALLRKWKLQQAKGA